MSVKPHSDLFSLGEHYFRTALAQLQQHGIEFSHKLQLSAADDLLCYYDLEQQAISLALPDRETAQGRLQLVLLRSLFGCDHNDEVIELLRLTLDWLIAHELAHHLRQHHGVLTANVWQEEQIANELALALSKPRVSLADRARAHHLLQRVTANLAQRLEADNSAVNSYHRLPHSLNTVGLIPPETLLEIEQHAQHNPCTTVLRSVLTGLVPDIDERLRNREQLIQRVNRTSRHDIIRSLYYYFGWLNIGLMSSETCTIREFAHRFLTSPLDHRYEGACA
ncbi:MAG: hypothetical protein J0M07_07555 [Anaerolineae bacterium]|nr:hypothetical protein [Anaerolineae bacterium]